jgi:hypothetical protein
MTLRAVYVPYFAIVISVFLSFFSLALDGVVSSSFHISVFNSEQTD